jgi:hypothetical protein
MKKVDKGAKKLLAPKSYKAYDTFLGSHNWVHSFNFKLQKSDLVED